MTDSRRQHPRSRSSWPWSLAGARPSEETKRIPALDPRGRALAIVALVALALALTLALERAELAARAHPPLAPALPYDEALAYRGLGDEPLDLSGVTAPEPIRIRRGQTVAGLLSELGLEPSEVYSAVTALGEHIDLRKVRAGEEGAATFDLEHRLARLELKLSGKGRVELERRGEAWASRWHELSRQIEVRRVEGELTDFLESAIVRGGGLPQLGVAMSLVLQWDLDFNRDLRLGDRFQVLYEEVLVDGERAEVGDILALTYENRGRKHEAYRHGESGGYYNAEGRPLQKMFLRSPLPFTRVTSRFSHRRFHPVLKIHRPHYGVDYGAPTGTPVRATAAGTVIFASRKSQTGNMVKIRHPNGYMTAYLHLSGFGRGVRIGRTVAQGDVIGYVGSTGLATAPHLDYRVQKNDQWIDPLSLESKPAPPIPEVELPLFIASRDDLRLALTGGASLPTLRVTRHRKPVDAPDHQPPDTSAAR